MNDKTLKALDRALDRLERSAARSERRRSRFSTGPILLALALVVGYQILVRLVPAVWAEFLPGGLEQARMLRGWPGLVASLALLCRRNFSGLVIVLGGVVGSAWLLGRWSRILRFLVWLAALAVILLDAGLIYVTLRTSLEVTVQSSGLG
jgi:hypothetical protein